MAGGGGGGAAHAASPPMLTDSSGEGQGLGAVLLDTDNDNRRLYAEESELSPMPSPDSELSTPSRLGHSQSYQDLTNTGQHQAVVERYDDDPAANPPNVVSLASTAAVATGGGMVRRSSFIARKNLQAILNQADYSDARAVEAERLLSTFSDRFIQTLAEDGPHMVRAVLNCVYEQSREPRGSTRVVMHVRPLQPRVPNATYESAKPQWNAAEAELPSSGSASPRQATEGARMAVVACSSDRVPLFGHLVSALGQAEVIMKEGRAWCSSDRTTLCIIRGAWSPPANGDAPPERGPGLTNSSGHAMSCDEDEIARVLLGALLPANHPATIRPAATATAAAASSPSRILAATAMGNQPSPLAAQCLGRDLHHPLSTTKRTPSRLGTSLDAPPPPTTSAPVDAPASAATASTNPSSVGKTILPPASPPSMQRAQIPRPVSAAVAVPMLHPRHVSKLEKLVEGGNGEVWHAYLHGTGDVALKVLTRHTADPAEVEAQWMREALALASMPHHPSIVRFFGALRMGDTGAPAIILELVRGGPAAFALSAEADVESSSEKGPRRSESPGSTPYTRALAQAAEAMPVNIRRPCMPVPACRTLLALAEALSHAHASGVVHRDVKGSNVLVPTRGDAGSSDGMDARLCDWGVACVRKVEAFAREGPPQTSGIAPAPAPASRTPEMDEHTAETGTHRWMAPEVFDGRMYGCSSDVYSYGVTMWELIAGQVPHPHLSPMEAARAALAGARPDVAEVASNMPESFVRLMERCWAHKPVQRPTMPEVVTLMQGVLDEALARSAASFDGTKMSSPPIAAQDRPRQISMLSEQLSSLR